MARQARLHGMDRLVVIIVKDGEVAGDFLPKRGLVIHNPVTPPLEDTFT